MPRTSWQRLPVADLQAGSLHRNVDTPGNRFQSLTLRQDAAATLTASSTKLVAQGRQPPTDLPRGGGIRGNNENRIISRDRADDLLPANRVQRTGNGRSVSWMGLDNNEVPGRFGLDHELQDRQTLLIRVAGRRTQLIR